MITVPDSKVHGANLGPIWGRQDPGGPHVGRMNFVIWGLSWYIPVTANQDGLKIKESITVYTTALQSKPWLDKQIYIDGK